jgi:O-antigen ligase
MRAKSSGQEEMIRFRETAGVWMVRLFLGAVLAAAPLFLFPRARYAWVGIVLGGMLVARGAIGGRILERTPLDWGIGLLAMQIAVSCAVVPNIELSLPKVAGTLLGINPNALAGSLRFVIPVALVLLFSGKARAARIALLGMVSLVFLAVMFLLQAVSVWLAFFISLGFVGMKKKKRLWIAAGGVLILGFFLLSRPARTVIREKFEIRYGLWSTGVTAVQRHPLLGIGMDRLRYDPGIGHELVHAHNQLIHTAAELGIPGLAAYLAILIGAGWMCLDVSKRARAAWMRDSVRGLGAGQLAFLIFGMGDAIPLGGKNGVFFWVSLALIAAMYNYVNRRSEISG